MKVVDAIAEIMKREGVEFLSTYPTTPVIDAAAAPGIRPVLCPQAGGGVGPAHGCARPRRRKRLARRPPGLLRLGPDPRAAARPPARSRPGVSAVQLGAHLRVG